METSAHNMEGGMKMATLAKPFLGSLALVTGGASGIGEAVCQVLAAEGATLVVADKQLEAAQKVAQSLPGDSKHLAVYVDVGDSESVENLFSVVRGLFTSPLNIVVNCAGILRFSSVIDCSDELFDDVMRVNLKGTFLVNRAASQDMLRPGVTLPEGGAAIVNIASIGARGCAPEYAAYAASKAGVVALTKTLAKELASHGIRCNAVLPGWTTTPMIARAPPGRGEVTISNTPLKRAAEPREIAEAVKFFCCPTASSYVTGATLDVTGGLHM